MIDIHTHILPNVDDGADSFEKAVEMLKQAKEQGVTHIILTPHSITTSSNYVEKSILEEKFNDFVNKIKDIGIKVYLGSEIYFTDGTYHKLVNNELRTFNNSKYCIVEFPMHGQPDIDDALFNVSAKGFKPILAHPERYKYLDIEDVKTIKKNAMIQVNTTSILGMHGRKIKKFAFQLLKNNLVDFVSTDCHNTTNRNVNLLQAYKIVSKKFGKELADKVFKQNQEKLISEIDENKKEN